MTSASRAMHACKRCEAASTCLGMRLERLSASGTAGQRGHCSRGSEDGAPSFSFRFTAFGFSTCAGWTARICQTSER